MTLPTQNARIAAASLAAGSLVGRAHSCCEPVAALPHDSSDFAACRRRQPPSLMARRKPKPTAKAPDASPATRRPMSPPCTRPATCAWAARIATAETPMRASRRVSLPASPEYNQVKQTGASAAARSRTRESFRESRARLHRVAEGKSRVRALRQSRRFARRAGNLRQRRMPRLGSAQRFHQHDDHRRNALGRGALQQRRLSAQRHAIRRKLRARRRAANRANDSAADRRKKREPRASCRKSLRSNAGKFRSPATSCACSNAAAARRAKSASPCARTMRASPTTSSAIADSARSLRTDPVFLGLQKTRLLDPLLSFPGTNDQPGDYRASGCTACHVVYANDRSAAAFRAIRAVRQSRLQRVERSHDSARRVRPSDPPRIHALDSVQPVHGLPHASRHEHGDHLFRLHLVGQRIRRRRDVSEAAAQSHRRRKIPGVRSAIPKARRRAGSGPT